MDEEYIDHRLGWHIKISRTEHSITYVYKNTRTGETIEGMSLPDVFKPPQDTIRKHIEETNRINAMRKAGVMGNQISRRILEMIGELHKMGYESLYIDLTMAPSGCYWRYEIGAMIKGHWPCRNTSTEERDRTVISDSIGGGYEQIIPWGKPDDSLEQFVDGFRKTYPDLLREATEPNAQYAKWYQDMLEATRPEGLLIFCSDYGPDYEYAFTWGEPEDFKMPMPPGFLAC